jgi:hypothetical protein
MSIINKFQKQGSTLSSLNGATPSIPVFADSKLHNEYSIIGNPSIAGKPSPSNLDLDGKTPSRYSDNLPR